MDIYELLSGMDLIECQLFLSAAKMKHGYDENIMIDVFRNQIRDMEQILVVNAQTVKTV